VFLDDLRSLSEAAWRIGADERDAALRIESRKGSGSLTVYPDRVPLIRIIGAAMPAVGGGDAAHVPPSPFGNTKPSQLTTGLALFSCSYNKDGLKCFEGNYVVRSTFRLISDGLFGRPRRQVVTNAAEKIRLLSCPEHHQQVNLTLDGDSLIISGCCLKFEKQARELITQN
jgi:hypothetical protein